MTVSAAHIASSAQTDMLEDESDILGSSKPLLAHVPGADSSTVKKSVVSAAGKPSASPPASQPAPKRPKTAPTVPTARQSHITSVVSKVKPSTTQKADKSLKRLSRDSPVAGHKSR